MKLFRYTTIVCLICLCFTSLRAQEVTYSPYSDFDVRTGDFTVVGKVDDNIYTYRADASGYFLDVHNNKMELVATVILDFLPKRVYSVKFITYSNNITFLYQTLEDGSVTQYAAKLNKDGMLIGSPNIIAVDQTKQLSPKRSMYEYAISTDKQRIVVYSITEIGDNPSLQCIWLDENANKQSRTISALQSDRNISYGAGLVADDGKFFLPVYIAVGGRDYAERVWLLSMNQGSNEHTTTELDLEGLYASATYMELDNNSNKLYIGGFYSAKKSGNFDGVIYTYYDVTSKSFQNKRIIPFDEKIKNTSGYRNKNRAFNDFRAMQLIIKNDGGFVLVAENFYITTRSGYNQGVGYYSWYYQSVSTSIREYHYGDILTLSYDGNGTIEWYSFIRKNQYSQEDGGVFSSYAIVNSGGALGFLFNDFNASRSRLQLASVYGTGDVELNAISTLGAKQADWLPRSGLQVSSREMIIPCLRKQQICFAKIVF